MILSLRYRIVGLITLFAIALVTVFCALLLYHQLHVINENNQYRARVGTFAAKEAFERTLQGAQTNGEAPEALQRMIPLLKEGQLAEQVTVSNLKGEVIASSSPLLVGTFLTQEETTWAEHARKAFSSKAWFIARVYPGQVALFTPIVLDEVPHYVAIFRYSLGNMADALREVGNLCLLVALGVIFSIVPLGLLLIQAILRPIQILNRATKDIAAGNLSEKVSVPTQDELGELAETFNQMTSALVRLKERAENANPLTKLPGNNVIHEEIEKRIREGTKFVAIYCDLDNFKAFNDNYGIAVGDQAIRLTATILREAVRQGNLSDFLGHEGGDDFILLTSPEKADPVTQFICSEFDRKIQELYSTEDRQRGHILSKDREGNAKRFPIMTLSLAGVTNVHRPLSSYAEVTNICAEVKKKVKSLSKGSVKSTFYLDRRTGQEAPAPPPEARA